MVENKSFLAALFDVSFSEFITTKLIKIIFVIGIVIAAIVALFFIIGAFVSSFWAGLGSLIISPIIFLIYVLIIRIWLELIIVIFKIAENSKIVAEK
ncbi:MAG: hypothetical protein APR54_00480 [Candidatus Cloacimonas sp. SDB]|nr:MAG: hypothetical protein APR54_00480 [Candidatus Cloacimonas sp. SDB]